MAMGSEGVTGTSAHVDAEFIRRAIDQAQLNALRLALYQSTRDPELATMRVETFAPPGTPFLTHIVADEHRARLQELAFSFLLHARPEATPPPPDRAEALRLMAMFEGGEVARDVADYGYEELAIEAFPRDAAWSDPKRPPDLAGFSVVVIGAGFSGILAGIQLSRLGIPFRILERQASIGGTWELNDYPEARVDITTFLYQYTFIKNYPWRSHFATRDELKEYIDHVVDRFDLRERIETGTRLTHARWDNPSRHWVLDIARDDGRTERFSASVVISAAGLFSTPNLPDIPGIGDYRGAMFHTTAWDHGCELTSKQVALIGTGSTGSQLMPALAARADHLTVFQRTPNWVTPVRGYRDPVTPEQRWLLDTLPFYANWFSYHHHMAQMQSQKLHEIDPGWVAAGGHINKHNDQLRAGLTRYIRRKVGSREDLFRQLVPDYAPMARRLVVDNGWYDTLLRPNVALVTTGIERFTPTGIVTLDGAERRFDVVVLGAGFQVSRYLFPVDYVGRDGATLGELWDHDGARAYHTVCLPGFPNFFMLYGPNAGVRAGSFHSWMEILMRYIAQAIVEMVERGAATIEVRREAYDKYNDELDTAMARMLWESEKGGGGYYVNSFGRSGVNMPWTLAEFYARVRRPDLADFRLQ